MKKNNIYWVIAGFLNLFTFLLHLVGGQLDLVDPMLDSAMNLEVKSQLVGAWNMVTIILLVTSIVLLLAGFRKKYNENIELITLVGYLNLSFCLPFLVAGFYYGLLVPQWIFFLPIGVLVLVGVKKNKIA